MEHAEEPGVREHVSVFAAFDHEEVGPRPAPALAGPFLEDVLCALAPPAGLLHRPPTVARSPTRCARPPDAATWCTPTTRATTPGEHPEPAVARSVPRESATPRTPWCRGVGGGANAPVFRTS
ncbi:hypothetical protein QJS66_10635 [Kocuria rhizophila]|nr:hypothetical protein QJS66_10635 [Kocuria rhizophila]